MKIKKTRQFLCLLLALSFAVSPLAPVFAQDAAKIAPEEKAVQVDKTSPASDVEKQPEAAAAEEAVPAEEEPAKPEELANPEEQISEDPVIDAPEPEINPFNLQPPSPIKQALPDVDVASGALSYSYPFMLPEGRAGVQPELALSYNSQNSDEGSLFGFGWNLTLPSIERKNLQGTGTMFSALDFSSSLDGDLKQTQASGSTISFAPKIDTGTFVSYSFNNQGGGSWIARTKSGLTYTFGTSAAERLDNPANSNQVFRWYLSEIKDARGNFAAFKYAKINGQVYPQSITYTNFAKEAGLFKVDFVLEGRPDTPMSAKTGFAVSTVKRLQRIDYYVGRQLAGSYELSYINAPTNGRSQLAAIRFTGYDDNDQPSSEEPVLFEYGSIAATNLLSKITQPTGGTTSVAYKPSARYTDADGKLLNPRMPFSMNTVEAISYDDVNGMTWSNAFQYAGGWYYYNGPLDRRFVGFEKVVKTDAVGNKIISYYHQGNGDNAAFKETGDNAGKAGKMYKSEIISSDGKLYKRLFNGWETVSLPQGRTFVKMGKSVEQVFDGLLTHADRAVSYGYDDTNGNFLQEIRWGAVAADENGNFSDTGNDKFTTTYAYATNSAASIYAASAETLSDQNGQTVSRSRNYYDGLPLGQLTIGNQTKQENLKSGSRYAASNKTYDHYGLVTEERDPRKKLTTYAYDKYHLYPAAITNPLNQATEYEYDYTSGKAKRTIDPNGFISETVFDGRDRVVAKNQSAADDPGTMVAIVESSYTDTPGNSSVKQTDYLSDAIAVDSYTYFDGFGRTVQQRTETEHEGDFSVKDTVYDPRSLVLKESLPYFARGSERSPATEETALYTMHSYDPLQRPLEEINAVGTARTAYDGRKTTVVDAAGKSKELIYDTYENLVQVNEKNGSATYATKYEYNGLNKLVKLTDALGNIRNFSYDSLGRVLSADDLHAPADTTFGQRSYAYDDAGNLVLRSDAYGAETVFSYDGLNRVLSEDYVSGNGLEVAYAYDNCLNGVGRQCHIETPDVVKDFEYTVDGNIKRESTAVAGHGTYETSYEYDRQDHQIAVLNPDGSSIANEYNNGGQLESVRFKEESDSEYRSVASNFDYNPAGLVTHEAFATGATDNDYDADALYRLRNKKTVLTEAGRERVVQDTTYSYDPVGNVTRLVEAADTAAAKTADYSYDDLHRLTKAVTVAGNETVKVAFAYDAIGNIISKGDSGTYSYKGSSGNSYANPHAVTSVNGQAYDYDRNGNMITAPGKRYVWDYDNRLVSAETAQGATAYTYDQDGQRLTAQPPSGSATVYVSDSYNIGDKPVKHIFANGAVIATVEDSGKNARLYDVQTDHLTGSSVISDDTGAPVEITDYQPFGEVRIDEKTGEFSEQRKFAGQEFDADTGLSYMNARYYDAALGRFLSEDPAARDTAANFLHDPQQLNLYSYVRNNPTNIIDPSGQCIWDGCILEAVFVGAVIGGLVSSFAQPQIANAPAPGDATYHIPESTIVTNIAVSSAIGGLTAGAAAIEYRAAQTYNAELAAETGVKAKTPVAPVKTYQTYEKTNPETGKVYVGRTSGTGTPEQNVKARDAGHQMTAKGYGPAQPKYSSSNPQAIRGQEQRGIDHYRQAGTSGNAINGISPLNPNRSAYYNAAQSVFGKSYH